MPLSMHDDVVADVTTGRAWAEFCDALKAAGEEVLRPGIKDPLDLAEGYRMLTRLLRGSLEDLTLAVDTEASERLRASRRRAA